MEDAKIAGSGQLSGGTYKTIKIVGAAKINDSVVCEEISIMGAATFLGSIDAKTVKVNGSITTYGSLKCYELAINGAISCAGEIQAELINLNGTANIQGDINVGILKANTEKARFKNIYGKVITIKCKKKPSYFNEIEATRIELANVKGIRISGNKLSILGRSEIETVEYRDELNIGEYVEIKSIVRL